MASASETRTPRLSQLGNYKEHLPAVARVALVLRTMDMEAAESGVAMGAVKLEGDLQVLQAIGLGSKSEGVRWGMAPELLEQEEEEVVAGKG